jgi:hypothetical protein
MNGHLLTQQENTTMALPAFNDEAEFRQTWIKPFLTKLGFILVTHSHGTDEQGKDFFFADFDRFEHPRFYAVQEKNGDIRSGDSAIGALLGQVQAAFEVRIRHRKGADEQRVSAVYIMASGRISPQARERISEHCRAAPYGENVHYLDADRLESLEKFARFRTDQDLRSTFLALDRELDLNARRLASLHNLLKQSGMSTIGHLRLATLELALSQTLPSDLVRYEVLEYAWNAFDAVNGMIDLINANSARSLIDIDYRLGAVMAAEKLGNELRLAIAQAIDALNEHYNLAIEIVPPA